MASNSYTVNPEATQFTGINSIPYDYTGRDTSLGPMLDLTKLTDAQLNQVRASKPAVDIGATLSQRGSRYGPFTGHARITQDLKHIMHTTHGWAKLTSDQKESLEMIVHKIGRILNGDPNYDDSWVDIAGYAKLVGDRLTTGKET